MSDEARDYWSFVEKLQDAMDYVQELLKENESLRRRVEELEKDKTDMAQKLATVRRLVHRERGEDPGPGGRLDGVDTGTVAGRARPACQPVRPYPSRRPKPVLRAV